MSWAVRRATSRASAPAGSTSCGWCWARRWPNPAHSPGRRENRTSQGTAAMDETTLRRLLEESVAQEPPMGPVAENSLRAGIRLRRRRVMWVAGGVAAAAAVAVAIPVVTGPLGAPPAGRQHGTGQVAVYVGYLSSGSVTPISAGSDTPGKPIKVGKELYSMAVTPDGKTIYVGRYGRAVTPIATATNTLGKPISLSGAAWAIAVTPDGKTAYVGNDRSGTVTPVATATNTPGRPIKVGAWPRAIAITPDGKTAYVADEASGTVTPIATATNTPGRPIKVGSTPQAIAITPDGKTAYVANLLSNTVTPIATATNTPGRTIEVPRLPEAIAITPDGKTAYVAVWDGVTSIDTATNTRGRLIKVGTRSIRGIAAIVITPGG